MLTNEQIGALWNGFDAPGWAKGQRDYFDFITWAREATEAELRSWIAARTAAIQEAFADILAMALARGLRARLAAKLHRSSARSCPASSAPGSGSAPEPSDGALARVILAVAGEPARVDAGGWRGAARAAPRG